jgi:uncharacterized protein YjbI with pentapeptide repeats
MLAAGQDRAKLKAAPKARFKSRHHSCKAGSELLIRPLERPKMKRLAIAILVAVACGTSAFAQNAGQIASVQAGKSCAKCNLFQADLSYSDLSRKTFAGARLRQSELSLATADGTNFARTDLSIANLYGVRATGANFAGANLERAVLVGGYFSSSNFAGANLAESNLSGAELAGARGLTQAQLNKACGDAETTLPRGLTVPACK